MPSDRLLRFRQYMAAFEGSADPAKSIDYGHYVHAPGQLLVDQIAGRIALRPNSTHLLVGGIGSGKTTQLLVAKKQLEDVEDLAVCYVDVSRYTDISQIEPGVLMTIVGLELVNRLPQQQSVSVTAAAAILKKSGYDHIETRTVKVNALELRQVEWLEPSEHSRVEKIQHKGVFAPIEKSRLTESVQAVSEALIDHTGKNMIFFCDGLDRLEDVDRFARAIRSDIHSLKQIGIGMVIVGPLLFTHSLHQGTKDLMDYSYYQPCFDVENSQEAQMFFVNVIAKRLPETDFFGSAAIQLLVKASGGVLRDLVTLTQAAIEEVYIAGDETLEIRHIEKALQTWARSRMSGISELEVAILRNHLQGKGFVLGSPESLKLLESRRVLEYNYPTVRYAVHPAIVPLLQPVAASA